MTVEGISAEEGLDTADARERIKLDPEKQQNFTETHPDNPEQRKM